MALHTAHVACLALQACRSKEAAKSSVCHIRELGFNRVYKRCAHSAHHAHSVYRIRASSGLTARHVIYRCAASRPWRINVFSRRLPTYTCKAGLRNRTVRRATGEKSSMVCGALWHGVPSICLQNGLLHPYIAEKNRCAATRGRPFSLQRGVARRENHNFEISLKCPT